MASEQRHRCEECGGELTCCGPMTEDGPLLDCLLCQRSEIITKLKAQLAARDQQAGNVLARIHRDGGHYITQHGWEKACVDADAVVCRLQAQLAASEEKRKVRVVLRSESKYVGMKILNWDTDAPILANPSKYETLRPGQSLVIMEADATDAASALEAP